MQASSKLDYHDAQTVQVQFGKLTSPQQPPFPGNCISSCGNDQEDQLSVSVDAAGAEDEWGLHGVDVALFNSLFGGTAIPDSVEEETWAQWAGNG